MADQGGLFSGELGAGQNSARYRWGEGPERELIGGVVSTEELWDCTTCGACMEQCPVLIEHVPLIVGMRRNLVLEQSEFPDELTNVFNNLERLNSPYQFPPNQRDAWTKKMAQPVRIMAEAAAAEEEVEVLFFVGCLGSFDSRNQRTTMALARILQAAGINFAILGKEETCTGDPARRVGNEYLAQMMAMQTVETLNQYSFKKIVTACPHCFNAIKNEYPQIGGNYEVVHHSELISQLIAEGRIAPRPGFRHRARQSDLPRPLLPRAVQQRLRRPAQRRQRLAGRGVDRDAAQPQPFVLLRRRRRSPLHGGDARQPHQPGARHRGARHGRGNARRLLPLLHDDVRGRHQRRRGERPPASPRHRRTRRSGNDGNARKRNERSMNRQGERN